MNNLDIAIIRHNKQKNIDYLLSIGLDPFANEVKTAKYVLTKLPYEWGFHSITHKLKRNYDQKLFDLSINTDKIQDFMEKYIDTRVI